MTDSVLIRQRLKEHLEETIATSAYISQENADTAFFIIAVNGSHNYNLATKNSDIDSKLLLIPNLDNLIWNKSANYLHVMSDNGEHVEVKDIRHYMATILKQNINFVETLFAKALWCNGRYEHEWATLVSMRESIARYNPVAAIDCMLGMARQKQIQMTKISDGRAENIKKFGYDTKSFHHCMRLLFFAEDYMRGKPYEECLTRGDNDTLTNWLIKAKTGELGFSLEKANDCINCMMANIEPQVDYFKNRMGNMADGAIKKTIDDIVTEIIKRSIGA